MKTFLVAIAGGTGRTAVASNGGTEYYSMAKMTVKDAKDRTDRQRRCGVSLPLHPFILAETDSGLDSSEDEPKTTRGDLMSQLNEWGETFTSQMALERNIRELECDINVFVDTLVETIHKRKEQLLKQVHAIHEQKASKLADTLMNQQNDRHKHGVNYQLNPVELYIKSTEEQIKAQNDTNSYDIAIGSCLRFVVEKDVLDKLEDFGAIDEGRSVASKSQIVGTGANYSFVNELTEFMLVTCNSVAEQSWVPQDNINVEVANENGCSAQVDVTNKYNGIYHISYKAPMPGRYVVNVTVNGQILPACPIKCHVFPICHYEFETSPYDQDRTSKWTLQHGNQSALLADQDVKHSSKIHTKLDSQWYSTRCWRVRLTLACPKVALKLGCAFRSNISRSFDEEYYSLFQMADYVPPVPSTQDRRNGAYKDCSHGYHHHHHHHHSHHHHSHHHNHRKQSTYKRTTITFLVIMDREAKTIRTIEYDTGTEKLVCLGDTNNLLQPYFGIRHFCKNETCPRPILSLV